MIMARTTRGGIGLVEVVIAAAIISGALVAVLSVMTRYLALGLSNPERVQAAYLAEEGVEIARALRDTSWASFAALSTSTSYHLSFNGLSWSATTTATSSIPGFTRTLALDSVYRRSSDHDIVPATSTDAKYLDPDARLVTVSVVWGGGLAASAVSYEGGLTDGSLASFPSNNAGDGDAAQSFTTGADAVTVGNASLFLKRVSNPSNVYLEIRSGSTVGTLVATSDTLMSSTIPTSALTWTSFTFPSQPLLAANTTYYLRLRSTPDSTIAFSGSSGTLNWGYLQNAQSPYAGGIAYRYVARLGNPSDQGQALTQYDFSFKVETPGGGNALETNTYLTRIFDT